MHYDAVKFILDCVVNMPECCLHFTSHLQTKLARLPCLATLVLKELAIRRL